MLTRVIGSWGNVQRVPHEALSLRSRFDPFPRLSRTATLLPFGNGRSYGDSCLNAGGSLLQMRTLSRFIRFDRHTGVIACEAGVLLGEILQLIVPAGWFLAVVPGTQFVTVGGAIANDVHGKNHHRVGAFGNHVLSFELLRSTGERIVCTPKQNTALFHATIGGLGLTGVITWAELQLQPITGPWMDVESIRVTNLAEYFDLAAQSHDEFEYVVSWIDCLASGKRAGRGVLQRANHRADDEQRREPRRGNWGVPRAVPVSFVNSITLRVANTLLYHRQHTKRLRAPKHYQEFFFPLDGIVHWNRLYGPKGFYQYQCIIPGDSAEDALRELLTAIAGSGQGSFLAVLKHCGGIGQQGLLSFPMHGVTLAVDFPNRGADLERLFRSLDAIVSAARGRLYPAKDGRMPREMFRAGYPRWLEFCQFIDPRFSSSFWRRVGKAPNA
jgi:FAD/FMN-containing dehydrogenase